LQLSAFGPNGRFGSRARMSNTQPLVAAAAGVPQRADPLPLAPAMTVPGQQETPALQNKRRRAPSPITESGHFRTAGRCLFARNVFVANSLPIIVLVIGGGRAGPVLAANALDAMFLVRGYLARNRKPAIKGKVGD
jgi:hypothetical protein